MAVAENSHKDPEFFALPELQILSVDGGKDGIGAVGPASHPARTLVGTLTPKGM